MRETMINLIGFVLCALLYSYSDARATDSQEFSKKWFSNENVTYHFSRNPANYKNNFVFSTCTVNENHKEMDCNVTVEGLQTQSTSAATNFCGFKLIAGENKKLSPNKIVGLDANLEIISSIDILSKDHIVIAWLEKSEKTYFHDTLKVSIFKMKDCTFVAPALTFFVDEDLASFMYQLLPYQDTFDVAVSNKTICNGVPSCRMTYNLEGKLLSGPLPLAVIDKHAEIFPVSSSSSEKGFFAFIRYGSPWSYINLYYITPNNTKIDLINENVGRIYCSEATSNAHEKFGSCWLSLHSLLLRCVQFDPKVENMMVMNVTFNWTETAKKERDVVQVHNLKDGGILLATLTGQNQNNEYESHKNVEPQSLIVRKINSDGSQQKIVEMTGLDLKYSVRTFEILENEKEICFYIICKNKYNGQPLSSNLRVNVKCILK